MPVAFPQGTYAFDRIGPMLPHDIQSDRERMTGEAVAAMRLWHAELELVINNLWHQWLDQPWPMRPAALPAQRRSPWPP